MNSIRPLRLVLAIFLGALLASGCGGRGPGSASSRPVLRVGVSPTYPPVIFEDQGEIRGIEADFARRLGDALGRRIVFEVHPFPDLIDTLLRGEIDVIMSGMSITPERRQRVRFTEPYMTVGQLLLIRSSDIARLGRSQLIRRKGARIGYERGTSGERFVADQLPRATSFAFDSVDEGIRSLRAGRIDYFIHDAPTVWRLAGDPSSRDLQGLYQPLTREELAWAVRPDDAKLWSLLDATLAHWKREGLIEPIIDRWIPVRVTVH
ncbi:MAG TPA: transporter substrate-binding domain-containing protein [Deltaproteobacteria bacterium]|nr:transporter substrate-binding domain-containing protein [Deltaproteobacteria bacterium]